MTEPLSVYDAWLRDQIDSHNLVTTEVTVRLHNGSLRPSNATRWVTAADAIDERALASISAGPVLDVGCGPGRHLHALARRGIFGMGVDLSAVAVTMARGGGSMAIVGSIFDELPHAGQWRGALLLDGNIGIGGDPERLLGRVRDLLAAHGQILVELTKPGAPSGPLIMRLEHEKSVSDWFSWADVDADQISSFARRAGLYLVTRWVDRGRWFACLARP